HVGVAYQLVRVMGGRKYRVTAHYRQIFDGTMGMFINFTNARNEGINGGDKQAFTTAGSDWRTLSVEAVTPRNADCMVIGLGGEGKAGNPGKASKIPLTVDWDDVTVTSERASNTN